MIGVIGAEQAVAFDVRVHDSVREIAQDAWDACFTDEAESWAYYAATEAALLPGFTWCYFAVRERGQVIAVAPAFITEYRATKKTRRREARSRPKSPGIAPLAQGYRRRSAPRRTQVHRRRV